MSVILESVALSPKRKQDAISLDDDESYDGRTNPVEARFLIKSRDTLEVQKNLCLGILEHPTSKFLNGMLLVMMVRGSITKRVASLAACERILSTGLDSYRACISFLGPIEKHMIDYHLRDRDPSLATIFEQYCQRQPVKPVDEAVALVLTQCERRLSFIKDKQQKKNDDAVRRVTNAAKRLAILPSSSSTVENRVEELIDDTITCVVCLDRKREICCVPCGHIFCCKLCSIALDKCSICSTSIAQKVEFFLA